MPKNADLYASWAAVCIRTGLAMGLTDEQIRRPFSKKALPKIKRVLSSGEIAREVKERE